MTHTLGGAISIPLTHYGYQHDELDRPYRATLLDGSTWTWGRNARGEITSAIRKLPGDTPVPALGATYEYDDIGTAKPALPLSSATSCSRL